MPRGIYERTEENLQKLRDNAIRVGKNNKGKVRSEETKQKISRTKTGVKQTQEHIRKRVEAKKRFNERNKKK